MLTGPTSALASGYQIVAKHSGKCLDVSKGSTANGALLHQWECLGPSYTNQIFDLVAQGGSYYQLIARHSGKCVDVAGGSFTPGTSVHQWTCVVPPQSNQIWQMVPVSGSPGYFEFKAKHSGQCMDVMGAGTGNETPIKQYNCVTVTNQQWSLRSVDVKEHPSSPNLTSTNPISPANNRSPRVSGSAPSGSTVKLFATAACTGEPLAAGSAAELASPGISVSVTDNSTTNIRATATDATGDVSPCSTSLTYVEDSTNVVLHGGFESGLSSWNIAGVGEVVPSVTGSDWRTGSHSANFKLTGSQHRSELILGGTGDSDDDLTELFVESDEYYYGFSFKILSMTYGKAGAHNLIMQFKSDEGEGSDEGPNFGLQLWDYEGDKGLWTSGAGAMGEKTRFLAEVSEKQWHDIVIHFVASSTGKGSYELYLDGVKIDGKENVSMIVPGREFAYIKNGLYRNGGTNPGTSEILLDSATLGTTLASVGGLGHP